MKYLLISIILASFESIHGFPENRPKSVIIKGSTSGKFLLNNLHENERQLMAQTFRSLCLFKPLGKMGLGDDWTSGLKISIMDKISQSQDSDADTFMKKVLTEHIVNQAANNCNNDADDNLIKSPKQNEDIYEGVQNILTNMFSGNLIGVIQSSVGIRTPENVTNTFSMIMETLLSNIDSARQAINSGSMNSGQFMDRLRPAGNAGTASTVGVPAVASAVTGTPTVTG